MTGPLLLALVGVVGIEPTQHVATVLQTVRTLQLPRTPNVLYEFISKFYYNISCLTTKFYFSSRSAKMCFATIATLALAADTICSTSANALYCSAWRLRMTDLCFFTLIVSHRCK